MTKNYEKRLWKVRIIENIRYMSSKSTLQQSYDDVIASIIINHNVHRESIQNCLLICLIRGQKLAQYIRKKMDPINYNTRQKIYETNQRSQIQNGTKKPTLNRKPKLTKVFLHNKKRVFKELALKSPALS